MLKIISASALINLLVNIHVFASQRDVTHTACLDVVTNGLNNSSQANRLYLIGRENGIVAGVRLSYIKHNIGLELPSLPWPDVIDESCRIVIVDKTRRRSMDVFNETVFKIYTNADTN